MGSLRFRRWLPQTSAHARGHLGLLLAATALALAWGAVLDPAETVAGLHGALDQGTLEVRLPGAAFVTALATVATIISLVWAVRDRPALLVASWSALLGAVAIVFLVVPAVWHGAAPDTDATFVAERTRLERLAYGTESAGRRPAARWWPGRRTAGCASPHSPRATRPPGSDRASASSRSSRRTAGPRCAPRASRSPARGDAPRSRGRCRARS